MKTNIQGHAINRATNFSFLARRTDDRTELLHGMVRTLADCFDARPQQAKIAGPDNRATYYRLREGRLTARVANVPELVEKSHVKDMLPEGPLATVIESRGFVYVPDILSKQHYYLLDSNGIFSKTTENPLNGHITSQYISEFGDGFRTSGQAMSMVFGCLSSPDHLIGAFKVDAFPRGSSILPPGMEPADILNIVANVSLIAANTLDEMYMRESLEREREAAQNMYIKARELLYGATHAFAGRLTVPMGIMANIGSGSLPPEEADKAAEKLFELSHYIREYFAPVHRGSFEIEIVKRKLSTVDLLESEGFLADRINIQQDLPDIETDPQKVKDIMVEIVRNARKYSPEGGQVRVSACMQDNEIVVSVEDNGPGMTKEQLLKIFDGGNRFLPEINEGDGYGLYSCRKIVEKLGGRIWAESDGPGKGSTFKFTLPVN